MGDLAYRRLMDWYYLHEKPVPENTVKAAEEIGMLDDLPEVERVLSRYFELEVGIGWRSKRCDEEIDRINRISDAARENGAKGGRRQGSKDTKPRAKRGTKTQGLAAAKQPPSESEAGAKPQPSKGLATRYPVPGTRDPFYSVPDGTGAEAPTPLVDNFIFHVPSSFPPGAATIAPPPPMPPSPPEAAATPPAPSPLVPPPAAPPAPLMPAGGLFDDDARNRLLDAAADELDPDDLDRLRTGAPPPLSVLPLREPDEFVLPRGPFVDEKDEIYKIGKPLLVHGGMAKDKAGGMVTKWVRDTRNLSIVLDAIHEAVRTKAADPLTFIQRLVHDADRGRGRKAYPGSLKGMDYTAPSDFIEGFPEADLMSDWDGSPQ